MNALRTSLRGFFEFLERAGIVDRNPARVLRMARTGGTAPKGMRSDEVARLMVVLAAGTSVAARRDHALFAFMLGNGARPSSALALDVADLDLEGGTATLREQNDGGCSSRATRSPCGGPVFATTLWVPSTPCRPWRPSRAATRWTRTCTG